MSSTKKKGDEWELIAIKYLQEKWYIIWDVNFKFSKFWEIDIIATKEHRTYFIEVKYRNTLRYGTPEESISKTKLMKLKKTLHFYVIKQKLSFEDIQFDVIAILKQEKSYKLTHYKNIEI